MRAVGISDGPTSRERSLPGTPGPAGSFMHGRFTLERGGRVGGSGSGRYAKETPATGGHSSMGGASGAPPAPITDWSRSRNAPVIIPDSSEAR